MLEINLLIKAVKNLREKKSVSSLKRFAPFTKLLHDDTCNLCIMCHQRNIKIKFRFNVYTLSKMLKVTRYSIVHI